MKNGEREHRETANGKWRNGNGRKWERKVKKEWEGKFDSVHFGGQMPFLSPN